MRATDLSELAAFDAVARHRSFRRAARNAASPPRRSAMRSAISKNAVGIRLLNRTTRSVSLTDAGAMLQAHLSPAFGDIGAALDALNQFRDTPFGKVRINVPNSIAPFVLGRVMGPLLEDQSQSRARDRRDRPAGRHRRGRVRCRHPPGREPARGHGRRQDQAATALRGGRLARLFRAAPDPADAART